MAEVPSKISSSVRTKYQVADNTFSYKPKDDEKDRLETEVGDAKQPDRFYPQVKIKRWDNEVNFSARLKDNGGETETISTKDEKIVWDKGKRKVEFYDLPISEEHPEGGYEFEVVLKEKPATNVVEFTIQMKGLEFFYQPPLNQEKPEEGQTVTETDIMDKDGKVIAHRPENVVGSYAVYYKDCPANYVDGKLYRTGKAFHIFRPRIEDAVGNWAWGELKVDEANGILSVAIPQEFLDNAVYPVRHAAGLTFGYTTQGASYEGNWNYIVGSKFTTPSDMGTPTSISCYIDGYSSAGLGKNAIYDTSYNLIASSTTTEFSVPGDRSVHLQTGTCSPTLSASTAYFLVNWSNINVDGLMCDAGAANQTLQKSTTYTGSAFPSSLSSPTMKSTKCSIYCTYTAAASGTKTQINIGDTWKTVTSMQINIGDTWKAVTKVQINIGDTWKTVF